MKFTLLAAAVAAQEYSGEYAGANSYYQATYNQAYTGSDAGHYIPRYYTPPKNDAYASYYAAQTYKGDAKYAKDSYAYSQDAYSYSPSYTYSADYKTAEYKPTYEATYYADAYKPETYKATYGAKANAAYVAGEKKAYYYQAETYAYSSYSEPSSETYTY